MKQHLSGFLFNISIYYERTTTSFIDKERRRLIWEIYSRVTHYDEDLIFLHQKMIVQGKDILRPEMHKELDLLKDEIRTRINHFLQLYAN